MVKSVQESVRIPSDLVKMIDEKFVDTGLFSSRADFVSSAIRYYYENSVYQFAKYSKTVLYLRKNDPKSYKDWSMDGNLNVLTTIQVIFRSAKRMHKLDQYEGNGEKTTVLLRLPPRFVDSYVQFIHETGIYKSKAEFYNYAIETYLDAQYYVDGIMDGIHHRDAFKVLFYNDEDEFMNRRTPIQESESDSFNKDDVAIDTRWDNWLDEYDGMLPLRFG